MEVKKIKTKNWMEDGGTGTMKKGTKIVIYCSDKQDLSINEVKKIEDFISNLRP
jgi:hypothetical protein